MVEILPVSGVGNTFVALHEDGRVTAWGTDGGGSFGFCDQANGAASIWATSQSAATLSTNGNVNIVNLGQSAIDYNPVSSSPVVGLGSNAGAFAALHQDGSVTGFGDPLYGTGVPGSVSEPENGSWVLGISSAEDHGRPVSTTGATPTMLGSFVRS